MTHLLTGRLQARCSPDLVEPIAHETVRLYWVPEGEEGAFLIRSYDETRSREYLLMAQGRTDSEGRFRIEVDADSILSPRRSIRSYTGGPLSLEVYYRGHGSDTEPVQFSIGHITPDWLPGESSRTALVEHTISAEQFSAVRSRLDLWTIHGHVTLTDRSPAVGYRVSAYDADPLHDDFLGAAESDSRGTFRIDYRGSSFRPTPVAGIDIERGGPEIYFSVEGPDGSEAVREPSSRGRQRDRARSPNWFTVEIALDRGISPPTPLPPTPI